MGMSYSIGKEDFDKVRRAATLLLDSDGAMLSFDDGDTYSIDVSQTLALACGMCAAYRALLRDVTPAPEKIAASAIKVFIDWAESREAAENG